MKVHRRECNSATGAIRRLALFLGLAAIWLSCAAQSSEPVVSTFVGNGKAGLDGDGGDRRKASIISPTALVWEDSERLLYIDMGRETGGRVRRIDVTNGVIDTVAGGGTLAPDTVPARSARLPQGAQALAIDSRGNIYIGYESADRGRVDRVDAKTGLIARFAGRGDSVADGIAPEELAPRQPASLRMDAADNLYIVDAGMHAVFRIDAETRHVTTIAGTPGQSGHAGDGGAATSALLNLPSDIGWDRTGNLYIADRDNHVIREVSAADGTITTIAGIARSPGFAGDGGEARHAQFRYPQSLLVEDGQLLVADRMNHRIRRIDLDTKVITTIAGSHRAGYAGENVPALAAGIFEPLTMLRDHHSGGLLIVSARAQRIYLLGDPVDLPVPWWRSGWALATYLACLGLLTATVVQVRTRTLRARNAALESSVRQRARELEEQKDLIERQSTELAHSIEAGDRLLARVSHEFRTPLTVILGPIDRLLDDAADGSFREEIASIERRANRLLHLVEQLLGLVRLGHGNVGASTPMSAASVLRRAVASFDSRAAERGVRLELGPVQDLIVQSNAAGLDGILVNLLSNAIKFTPADGHVRVSLTRGGEMAQIEVEDSGCGMSSDQIRHLFEPTSELRTDEVTRDAIGLGLALVGQLVAAQDGSISVESEPGRGCRFRVRLPLAATQHASTEATADAPPPGTDAAVEPGRAELQHAEATVLVIEDNDDMREYLRQLVAPHYRCVLAADGERGCYLAAEEAPDLIVCDVMLPGRDGFSVCREIKGDERTSHIPVILLTALEGQEHKLRGLEARADDYLTKPFDEAELLQRVRNLLEIRRLLQRRYAREPRFDEHPPADLNMRDQEFLMKVAGVTAARHGDPEFDTSGLAAALAVSERHLQRKLRSLTGLTPAEYVRGYRLQQSLLRLQAGERPGEVAYAVGFGSQAYFTTCFKAQFGHTPGEARERSGNRSDATAS